VGGFRRPLFDELRAGGIHDVRNAEAAADLDQLSAGDEDFLSLCQGIERQHHGRRAIVDDESVLCAGQLAQQANTM